MNIVLASKEAAGVANADRIASLVRDQPGIIDFASRIVEGEVDAPATRDAVNGWVNGLSEISAARFDYDVVGHLYKISRGEGQNGEATGYPVSALETTVPEAAEIIATHALGPDFVRQLDAVRQSRDEFRNPTTA